MEFMDNPRRGWNSARFLAVLLPWSVAGCLGQSATLGSEGIGREVGSVDVKDLNEISGIAASRQNPGVLWVHDDGDIKSVYAVSTSRDVVVRLGLGHEAIDCEDMALGPGPGGKEYLYLGDIGDNDEARDSIRVFRLAEPALSAVSPAKLDAAGIETLELTYPDRPHDAETLLVDPRSGDLLIVTKEKSGARLYRADAASWAAASRVTLERIADIDVDSVSAGDISRDGCWILLRREETGWLFGRHDEPIAAALARKPEKVPVRGDGQKKNGEAVAFHPDGGGYYTVSEGKRQPICFFALP